MYQGSNHFLFNIIILITTNMNTRIKLLIILAVLMLIAGTFGLISVFADKQYISWNKHQSMKSDYQIICGNDTLIIMDSTTVVKKIPYSDSSDIWQIIIEDNR